MTITKTEIDIVVFVMPWEIDAYRNIVKKIDTGIINDPEIHISLYSCLCLSNSVIDWQQSESKPQQTAKEFESINSKTKRLKHKESKISYNDEISGCVDWRRLHAEKCDPAKAVIWLDSDLVFPDYALTLIRKSIEEHSEMYNKDEYYIFTPQIPRMWDESWDCLVHKDFQKEALGYCYEFDTGLINKSSFKPTSRLLRKNTEFKFAGGWLTVISSGLLKVARIPESFRSYGEEDSYLMEVCDGLVKQGFPVSQYIMNGLLVAQDYSLFETSRKQLKIINDKEADAAYNKSIKNKMVCSTLMRIDYARMNLPGC